MRLLSTIPPSATKRRSMSSQSMSERTGFSKIASKVLRFLELSLAGRLVFGASLEVIFRGNERDHAAMVPAVQILWVERPRDPRADGRGRQSPSLKAQLYTDTTPVCLLTLSPCQGLRPQENESNHRSCNPVPRAEHYPHLFRSFTSC